MVYLHDNSPNLGDDVLEVHEGEGLLKQLLVSPFNVVKVVLFEGGVGDEGLRGCNESLVERFV